MYLSNLGGAGMFYLVGAICPSGYVCILKCAENKEILLEKEAEIKWTQLSTWMPVGRHMACPRMLKMVSLSSSLVVVGSSSSISFFSPGRRGSPSPWLKRENNVTVCNMLGLDMQDSYTTNTMVSNVTRLSQVKSIHITADSSSASSICQSHSTNLALSTTFLPQR